LPLEISLTSSHFGLTIENIIQRRVIALPV
jgi:hypothetical protein